MWRIDKVRPRVEWYRRPRLVRYEYVWMQSAYGAFSGTAATRRGAERGLRDGQVEMWAS